MTKGSLRLLPAARIFPTENHDEMPAIDEDYAPSDEENFSTPKRSNKREVSQPQPKKPKKAKKSKHEKDSQLRRTISKLTGQLAEAQTEIDDLKKSLKEAQEQAKASKEGEQRAQFQLKNAKIGGVDPAAVNDLHKQLDAAKRTLQEKEDELARVIETSNEKLALWDELPSGQCGTEDPLPYDKPPTQWTRLQLIQGLMDYHEKGQEFQRDAEEWKQLAVDEGEKVSKMAAVMKSKGITHESEMNKDLLLKARTIVKEIVSRKYKLLFPNIKPGKAGSLRTFYKAVYDELLISFHVLSHEDFDPPFDEFERIYGPNLWRYFKDLRQGIQTKCFQSVYGKSSVFCPI